MCVGIGRIVHLDFESSAARFCDLRSKQGSGMLYQYLVYRDQPLMSLFCFRVVLAISLKFSASSQIQGTSETFFLTCPFCTMQRLAISDSGHL